MMDIDQKLKEVIEESCERYGETFRRLAMGVDSDKDAEASAEDKASEGEQ